MNRTPPLSVPPPSPLSRLRKPPPAPPPGHACPAPHAKPLPCAVPNPASLPAFTPARPALFFALALSLSALALDCAQLDLTQPADAGRAALPSVSSVWPPPGAISAGERFTVAFSTPMDASLLLSDVARSETVVLVAQANAQVMAAAIAHARLTAAESALLIPADAELSAEAVSISLTPAAPLVPGAYALLVSARLKDATGAKLQGGSSEFDYTAVVEPAAPALLDPPASSSAPLNLARVRVSFSAGASGSIVSLVGPDGIVAAAAAPPEAGEVAIALCPDAPCAALAAGASYALTLDGKPIANASFTAAGCARDPAPALSTSMLLPRDSAAQLLLSLDWPARIVAHASPAPGGASAGMPDGGPACAGDGCTWAVFATCAPSGCGSDLTGACSAALTLAPLDPSTRYEVSLRLEDDEGHVTALPDLAFTTLATLPAASIEEVMAAPPPPSPRDEGEYLEIVNSGAGSIDVSSLALQGPDGILRPLLGSIPAAPILLEPGGYALAVGASFDPTRYPIPPGVPILRAATQRLLGRGLSDASAPAIALVTLSSSSDAGSSATVLSIFPGGAFGCPDGASLERVHPDPGPPAPSFSCGAVGGSPGRAP